MPLRRVVRSSHTQPEPTSECDSVRHSGLSCSNDLQTKNKLWQRCYAWSPTEASKGLNFNSPKVQRWRPSLSLSELLLSLPEDFCSLPLPVISEARFKLVQPSFHSLLNLFLSTELYFVIFPFASMPWVHAQSARESASSVFWDSRSFIHPLLIWPRDQSVQGHAGMISILSRK